MSAPPAYSAAPPRWTTTGNSPYLALPRNDTGFDPRTSSQQSLTPAEGDLREGRRKLLLIYIHGFKGTETSFQSFPAHVHNLVSITMADTHVVYTKIYPRYKSRNTLTVVAEDFSAWLTPNVDDTTDIILLGHSMGGLLAAEIVFLATKTPSRDTFRHQILGTINFDVPFLGLHPGIIKSGIASLFKPAAEPQPSPTLTPESSNSLYTIDSYQSGSSYSSKPSSVGTASSRPPRQDTLFAPPNDPNFNPQYQNDVILPPLREGWRSTVHFFQKHSNNIRDAMKQSVKMQAEFGRPLLDYRGLNERYARLRALESYDTRVRQQAVQRAVEVPRVRFINYYTACSGRPKTTQKGKQRKPMQGSQSQLSVNSLHPESAASPGASPAASRISLVPSITTSHAPDSPPPVELDASTGTTSATPPHPQTSPQPVELDASTATTPATPPASTEVKPPSPTNPPAQESGIVGSEAAGTNTPSAPEQLADKRSMSTDQSTTGDSHAPSSRPPIETQSSLDSSLNQLHLNVPDGRASISSSRSGSSVDSDSTVDRNSKPKKDRKFCFLPRKDQNGRMDDTWVRVYMEGVDEVGAHCGLFTINETYEKLVGDVGGRVEEWLREDSSERFARDTSGP